MIKVHCHTNLDECKHGWPSELPCIPRVGEKIRSAIKSPKQYHIELSVVDVKYIPYHVTDGEPQWVPYIELNIVGTSINEFYKRHGWML